MRILLTGVTGQIGSALAPLLASFGVVIPADWTVLDLRQVGAIASVLDRLKPDLIVNPAAYTGVDTAEHEEEEAFAINAEAPAAIAHWASEHNVSLIHFSTDYVYPGSGFQPWSEDDATAPLSAYAKSKIAGEEAIRTSGASHLIVRTSWVYATGEKFSEHDRICGA